MGILFVVLTIISCWLLSGLLAAFVSWKLDLKSLDWDDVELIDNTEDFWLCIMLGPCSLGFVMFVIYVQKIDLKLSKRFFNFFRDWAKNNV